MSLKERWEDRYLLVADGCFLLILASSLFSLVIWIFGIESLIDPQTFVSPMAPPSVFLFIFMSAAYFVSAGRRGISRLFISAPLLIVVMLACIVAIGWRLLEGQNDLQSLVPFTIDAPPGSTRNISHVSITALPLFLLSSLALFLRFIHPLLVRDVRLAGSLVAIAMLLLTLATLLGYLYGTPFLYAGANRPVALTNSLLFVLTGIATLALNGGGAWPLSSLIGNSITSRLMRTFLPASAALIALEGFFVARLEGMLEPGELALFTSFSLLLVVLVLGSMLVHLVGGASDREIERRKATEAKLKQAVVELERSNNELEHFAHVTSHDLLEPSRMVANFLQLFVRRYGDRLDGEALEFIAIAREGSERMQLLIRDLLNYSRVGSQQKPMVPVDANVALEAALMNLRLRIEEEEAEIVLSDLPVIRADDLQLTQVFQNLIGNALKFRRGAGLRIEIGYSRLQGEWQFFVADNGMGIAPEHWEKIFLVFQRLHGRDEYSGSGMGLAIVRRIVERHGGRTWLESEPGSGSRFYFTLPMKNGAGSTVPQSGA